MAITCTNVGRNSAGQLTVTWSFAGLGCMVIDLEVPIDEIPVVKPGRTFTYMVYVDTKGVSATFCAV
jgi:hypothetical protein